MFTDPRLEDLLLEWEELRDQGREVGAEELCHQCPELTEKLRDNIAAVKEMDWLRGPMLMAEPVTGSASGGDTPRERSLDSALLVAGGEVVPGYRLVARLGKGGFGEVWKAIGPGGIHLALKFVSLSDRADPAELRALDLIKDIRHPHLLPVFAAWKIEGFVVVAIELADETLLDRFSRAVAEGLRGIPVPEIHELFLQAAQGIDFLNEPRHALNGQAPVGIQHRDIKPQNLLLVGGSVKVADFGLVRVLEGAVTSHTGSMTPAYAAPEFFKRQTTSQSDQYSLAVAYCQVRGGRLPFTGTPEAIMAGHLREPPDLTMLAEKERPIVARALAKEPGERWPTCRAFVEALQSGEHRGHKFSGSHGRRRRIGIAVFVLLMVAAGITAISLIGRQPTDMPVIQKSPDDVREINRLRGHGASVTSVAFSPDGRRAVTGSEDKTVRVWDLELGTEIACLKGFPQPIRSVAFGLDGEHVAVGVGFDDNTARLWRIADKKELLTFKGHWHGIRGLAFLPGGKRLVTGSIDGTVRFWDLDDGKELYQVKLPPLPPNAPEIGATRDVFVLALSPDGTQVLCGHRDRVARLYDVATGELLQTLTGHRSYINAVAIAPDGQHVVTGNGDNVAGLIPTDLTMRLWDLTDGKEIRRFPMREGGVTSLAFSKSGRYILAAGLDGDVVLTDVATGAEINRLKGHTGPVRAVAVSASGQYALTGGDDGTVTIWRVPR